MTDRVVALARFSPDEQVWRVDVLHLLVSSAHAYEGRPADGPRDVETVDRPAVEVVAGAGIAGDRYFARRAHANAAVTLLAATGLAEVASALGLDEPLDPMLARRNVVLGGISAAQVAALRGLDFELGGLRFRAGRPAAPCTWMDVVYAPGAARAMRGRGGLRCAVLSSGTLRRGPTELRVVPPVA